MLKIQSNLNLEQLVVNETPTFKSAMLGYSRPLNDHFQISGDVTVVYLNEPIATSRWNKALSFEAEVGVTQTWSDQAGVKNNNTNLFLIVGFRYDFYADGATRNDDGKHNCLTPVAAALCRYSNAGAGMSCAAPPTGCR
jgi:hypothetical protein